MTSRNLLVELLVEELPPKALNKFGPAFASELAAALAEQGLRPAAAPVQAFATPRRLAARLEGVLPKASDQPDERKVMPVSVARAADGQPTPALLKKLAALGLPESAAASLAVVSDGKADVLVYKGTRTGATLAGGLQAALERALAQLPNIKTMSYQLADGWTSVSFVRPAHGLVALHGADVVPVSVLGLAAGRQTPGHRFESSAPLLVIKDADSYARQLEAEGAVIASFEARRAEILRQLQAAARQEGLAPIDDDALLDEVTALVERPNVLTCRFDTQFLAVPQECLILTMKANQKYFPLLDAQGRLTEKFLVVSNIRPADPSAIVTGNERVVRPRLADAKFFFDQDRKKTLESRVEGLAKVVYHNKLGSQGERVERVRAITQAVAQAVVQRSGGGALAASADTAARLAKADLLTDMVGEFPELQGTMGGYYARHDGHGEEIAFAVEDHYKPRFAGDALPRNRTGAVVALADKLETLAGLFGIGQLPSGDKDPFALRRHALGVIRLLSDPLPELALDQAIDLAIDTPKWPPAFQRTVTQDKQAVPLRDALLAFFQDRLAVMLRERGYSAQEVAAALEVDPWRLPQIDKRLGAVRSFAALPESESLAAANKRVANILKKSEGTVSNTVNDTLLQEAAEKQLHSALKQVKPRADSLFDRGEYTASLRELAALKSPVDAFFDQVMVNVDDPKLRGNRLALLANLHAAMNRVADLSKLAS